MEHVFEPGSVVILECEDFADQLPVQVDGENPFPVDILPRNELVDNDSPDAGEAREMQRREIPHMVGIAQIAVISGQLDAADLVLRQQYRLPVRQQFADHLFPV